MNLNIIVLLYTPCIRPTSCCDGIGHSLCMYTSTGINWFYINTSKDEVNYFQIQVFNVVTRTTGKDSKLHGFPIQVTQNPADDNSQANGGNQSLFSLAEAFD